jgi:hypothetical protein
MLYTPALAHEFEGYNAHFDGIGIADVAPSVHFNGVHQAFVELKSQFHGDQRREEGLSDASGASLVYAGYPYDPYT